MSNLHFGIDELRSAVRAFGNCNESFLQRYTAEELILIYRALARSEWDILPDEWTNEEIALALKGEGTGATCERGRDFWRAINQAEEYATAVRDGDVGVARECRETIETLVGKFVDGVLVLPAPILQRMHSNS